MAINIKKLQKGGVQIYPQTHSTAVLVDDNGKTLATRLTELASVDSTNTTGISTNKAAIKAINDKLGMAEGIATLDTSGKVPTSQLPGYVDDVLEFGGFAPAIVTVQQMTLSGVAEPKDVYYCESSKGFAALSAGKYYANWSVGTVGVTQTYNDGMTASKGKLFVDSTTNKIYRFSGTALVEISSSLALGEITGTAYDGKKGADLATKVTEHSSTLQYFYTRISGVENQATNNANDVYSLQSRMTTVEVKGTTNTTDITSLKTRMTAVEGKATAHDTSLSALAARIATIEEGYVTAVDL